MNKRARHLITFLAGTCLVLLFVWLATSSRETGLAKRTITAPAAGPESPPAAAAALTPARAESGTRTLVAKDLLAYLARLLNRRDARAREALLTFKDEDAYQRFLARARESGLNPLGRLDHFRTVRVGYDAITGLQRDMLDHAADYADVAPNFTLNIPTTPTKEERDAIDQVPFGNRMLEFLGVTGDRSQWGRGTTIAILDSGIAADRTFGEGRLRTIDIGLGTLGDSGHGTSVGALAAGMSADAPGVAPGANLLSIRVTDATGVSDVFTVAQAILAAVDTGAKVINISLGGYGTTGALDAAIGYAEKNGALIVAAAGNDQAAQLTWPAADSRVVSVGAVDALGQQVLFSNSGPQLQMTAPGYGVQTAWLDGQRVTVNGTSASAPIVAGAIAAVMSENPGYTAQQAWQALQQTANDSGAPGADSNYGNGILNLGWAMNRNNPAYIDTAVASHYYDSAKQEMDFVVQNRSGQGVGGLQLNVATNGVSTTYSVPLLAAGASAVIKVPVNQVAIKATGSATYATQLVNPSGITDRVPANNRRSTVLTPAK
ncbi:MAG TPA: S8 family serine peptidase [Opitutaceae bacterium]|nr:S8 family serine peptidase [Opitutaceae bacterium]